MIQLLFIILFNTFCLKVYAEERHFSAYVKNSNNLAVVKNNDVFFVNFAENGASYFVPNDNCYDLVNDFSFCVNNGKIHDTLRPNYAKFRDDAFFNQQDEWCNSFKYKITHKLFIEKTLKPNKTHQLVFLQQPTIQSLNVVKDSIKEDGKIKLIEYVYVLDRFNVVSCPREGYYVIYKEDELQKTDNKKTQNKKTIQSTRMKIEEETEDEKQGKLKKEKDVKFIKAIAVDDVKNVVIFYQEEPDEYFDFVVKDKNLLIRNIKIEEKQQEEEEDMIEDIVKRKEIEILDLYHKN